MKTLQALRPASTHVRCPATSCCTTLLDDTEAHDPGVFPGGTNRVPSFHLRAGRMALGGMIESADGQHPEISVSEEYATICIL